MSIYMKIDGVSGSVSAKGHENWISLRSLDWGARRKVVPVSGRVAGRSVGSPDFSHVSMTKDVDKASPLLFNKACEGQVKGEAIIHVCHSGDNPTMYLEYTLSDALISHFDHQGLFDGAASSFLENIKIEFSKIQLKYVPRDAHNKAQSPVSSGFDIIKAEVL